MPAGSVQGVAEGDQLDVAGFAQDFRAFLAEIHRLAPAIDSPLRDRAVEHLGVEPEGLPTLTERFEMSDRPNLQLAIDALVGDRPDCEIVGLPAEARHYQGFSLGSLLAGRLGFDQRAVAPSYVNHPIDIDETLACVEMGLWFFTFDDQPMVILVGPGEQHGPRQHLQVEVVATETAACGRFLDQLKAAMHERNVYRGKVLAFSFSEWGQFGIDFHRRLLDLYLRGTGHEVEPGAALDDVIDHTDGVSAAFIKELVRRTALRCVISGQRITAGDLGAALTDLLERSARVIRSTLGAGPGAETTI